jgi:hypothetical protein
MTLYLEDKVQHILSKRNPDLLISDNSSLSVWSECNRKYLYRVILSLRDPLEKVSLSFGKAFHSFLENYYKGKPFEECFAAFTLTATKGNSQITVTKDESIENGKDQEYSLEFGFLLCKKYAEQYPLEREYFTPMRDTAGEHYLEMGFALDLVNGIIIGLIDGLSLVNATQQPLVLEHKTTKYNINSSYFSDYNPNNQVSTYLYAASELLGKPVTTALINVIRVKDYKRGTPAENDEKLFGRLETSRDPEQLEQRMRHADFQLGQIKQSIAAGIDGFPMETQSCRTRYGECEYRKLCMAKTDAMLEILAETTYISKTWSPYHVLEGVEKVVEIDVCKDKNKVDVVDTKSIIEV